MTGSSIGIPKVQLIGGEPTLSPAFEPVLRHAVTLERQVQVYTNLFHVRDAWWELFGLPGVTLATSYYSDRAVEHDMVTTRTGSHGRTTANILEALARGISVRVGLVQMSPDRPTTEARLRLNALGVTDIYSDRLRAIGRPAPTTHDPSELCGACGRGKAAVGSAGEVWPCVMSRWMIAGNVLHQPLVDILSGSRWRELVATVPDAINGNKCDPDLCDPVKSDGSDCTPAHSPACNPRFCNPDSTPPPEK